MDTSTMTIKALNEYVGGLSNPSKMPGFGYSLPAKECKVGTRLREVAGSTCSGCYAMRGNYLWLGTQKAMYRRLEAISKPYWVQAMAELINRRKDKSPFFRWHDSGDIQSVEHLDAMIQVARMTPEVSHWIPTREYKFVREWIQANGKENIPSNFCIRLSAHMIGGKPGSVFGLPVSTVSKDDSTYPESHHCPARHQGNECGDCRACWNNDVSHVDYHKH